MQPKNSPQSFPYVLSTELFVTYKKKGQSKVQTSLMLLIIIRYLLTFRSTWLLKCGAVTLSHNLSRALVGAISGLISITSNAGNRNGCCWLVCFSSLLGSEPFRIRLRYHPFITSAKGLGGWIKKKIIFCRCSVLYLCWSHRKLALMQDSQH